MGTAHRIQDTGSKKAGDRLHLIQDTAWKRALTRAGPRKSARTADARRGAARVLPDERYEARQQGQRSRHRCGESPKVRIQFI